MDHKQLKWKINGSDNQSNYLKQRTFGSPTSRCSKMYGGLVIPTRIRQPSGMTSTSCHSNSVMVTPMSLP